MARSTGKRRAWLIALVVFLLGVGGLAYAVGLLFPPKLGQQPLVTPEPSQAPLPPVVSEPPGAPAEPPEAAGEEVPVADAGRVNLILLGIDAEAAAEQTRSDILVLVSLGLQDRSVTLVSIPRDSRMEIPGYGLDKVNHAHAFGGVPLTLQTLSNNLGLPLHHWATVDFEGFLGLLDVIGPITIDVPYSLTVGNDHYLAAGPVEMDSALALDYVRERYRDPEGDFGRSRRAAGFLLDLLGQVRSRATLGDLPELYHLFTRYAKTDLQVRELATLARLYWRVDLRQAERLLLPGQGIEVNGVYYYEIDWSEANRLLAERGLK